MKTMIISIIAGICLSLSTATLKAEGDHLDSSRQVSFPALSVLDFSFRIDRQFILQEAERVDFSELDTKDTGTSVSKPSTTPSPFTVDCEQALERINPEDVRNLDTK